MIERKHWSKIEKSQLVRILKLQKGYPDWKEISKHLKMENIDKSPKQCYMRWKNNKRSKNKKNRVSDHFKFDKKTEMFTKEEEKKLLKLSLVYAPKWMKIAKYFEGKNRFFVCNHFYGLIRKSFTKACNLLKIKSGKDILAKIKPRLFGSLINKDIRIDFREFKSFDLGKKDKNCPDFLFFNFFEFVSKLHFNSYDEILERISEREIYVVKRVIVYLIEMNFMYNRDVKMSKRKKIDFLKIKNIFVNFKKYIINSYGKIFFNKEKEINKKNDLKDFFLFEKFEKPKIENETKEIKDLEKKKKCFLEDIIFFENDISENFQIKNKKINEGEIKKKIFVFKKLDNPKSEDKLFLENNIFENFQNINNKKPYEETKMNIFEKLKKYGKKKKIKLIEKNFIFLYKSKKIKKKIGWDFNFILKNKGENVKGKKISKYNQLIFLRLSKRIKRKC